MRKILLLCARGPSSKRDGRRFVAMLAFTRACIAPCLLLCACSEFKSDEQRRVLSQDQAASVRVSAVMVAPWAEMAAVMLPAFSMTGDAAATQVLPTTSRVQDELLDAISVGLGLGLPQHSTQGTSTSTSNSSNNSSLANGVTTVTSSLGNGTSTTSTSTTSPGVVPNIPSGVPAGEQALPAASTAGALALDPVLRYKAANYLNEQVQLLNKEVQYAASLKCAIPYVVKLKVAVMTYKPQLSYSAHSFISFFGENLDDQVGRTRSAVLRRMKEDPDVISAASSASTAHARAAAAAVTAASAAHAVAVTAAASGASAAADAFAASAASAASTAAEAAEQADSKVAATLQKATEDAMDKITPCDGNTVEIPSVIPLLAADDMNVALKSNTAEVATQLGFALSFMEHNVGGSANFDKLKQSIHAISDQELSSSLTVTMQSPNTIYVRIAPNNEVDDPSLIGQTYDLAVLLLVPRGYFLRETGGDDANAQPVKIEAATVTQLRDATTGTVLQYPSRETYLRELDVALNYVLQRDDRKLQAWNAMAPRDKREFLHNLLQPIETGSYESFQRTATKQIPNTYQCDKGNRGCEYLDSGSLFSLWSLLNPLLADVPAFDIDFEVPRPPTLSLSGNQTALVLDDGKQNAQVVLYNVRGTSTAGFSASLSITPDSAAGIGSTTVSLPAQSMVLDPTTHMLTLTFPSPQKWKLRKSDDPASGVSASKGKKPPPVTAPPAHIYIQADCEGQPKPCPTYVGVSPLVAQIVTSASDAETSPANFKLVQGSNVIDESADGKGVLAIAINGLPKSNSQPAHTVAVSISGADVSSATDSTGAALALGDSGFVIRQNGKYNFNLFNLSPGAKVTVTAQEMKAQAGDGNSKLGAASVATYSVTALTTEARKQGN